MNTKNYSYYMSKLVIEGEIQTILYKIGNWQTQPYDSVEISESFYLYLKELDNE